MGFSSFLGRVLFASLFILSAWQMFNEFGEEGGPAAKELIPKLAIIRSHLSSKLGVAIPHIDFLQPRNLVAAFIALKGLGGFLFVFGTPFGAYLLLFYLAVTAPLLYDFYNYDRSEPIFGILLNEFLQSVALFGALMYFIGLKNLIPKRQIKKKAPKAKVG